ncbi:MAG: NADH-quinone oxidoreductase subunit A [Candidatus Micrarchaeota archaeon]|nr:NADH-quinone oxidoreductase subunit A [Candidatus Micrarchaeota archaeon]MDE1848094.1 NADH-quinone oxidoreductase subunit A [Candidatus Micrarchaeota archaeon]MDE1864778.1 NADH-quinone oxidoreductase subunit A [Candidatus Micrarchaeota archaeon]
MDAAIVSVIVFMALALFVPASMLLLSRLIGAKPRQNPIKLGNYESAEVPIGSARDITNEYLHYFPLYLGFEVVVVIILAWASVYGKLSMARDLEIIGISVLAFVMSVLALAIAHMKERNDSYGRTTIQ